MNETPFLTIEETCAELRKLFGDRGFSRANVAKMFYRGELPGVRLNGRIRIDKNLSEFFAQRAARETAERARQLAAVKTARRPSTDGGARTHRFGRPA